jgi:hypothetical protein
MNAGGGNSLRHTISARVRIPAARASCSNPSASGGGELARSSASTDHFLGKPSRAARSAPAGTRFGPRRTHLSRPACPRAAPPGARDRHCRPSAHVRGRRSANPSRFRARLAGRAARSQARAEAASWRAMLPRPNELGRAPVALRALAPCLKASDLPRTHRPRRAPAQAPPRCATADRRPSRALARARRPGASGARRPARRARRHAALLPAGQMPELPGRRRLRCPSPARWARPAGRHRRRAEGPPPGRVNGRKPSASNRANTSTTAASRRSP